MNRESFRQRRSADWDRLEVLLSGLEDRRLKSVPGGAEIPALYRRACQDLALVRSRSYGRDLEQRLHEIVLRGHRALYRGQRLSWERVGQFVVVEFPRLVRQEHRLVAFCTAFFLLPFVGVGVGVHEQPDLIYWLLGQEQVAEFEAMYADGGNFGRDAESDVLMFGFYIFNNIGIALRTFASGIFLGLGSLFILLFNGLHLGAVSGHLIRVGYGGNFLPFVVGHGAFELTGIVLAGAAGTRLGLSLLRPGHRSRARSLATEARRILPMIVGVALMLLVAAFVEAFWSASSASADLRYGVGALLWLTVFLYFGLVGRDR